MVKTAPPGCLTFLGGGGHFKVSFSWFPVTYDYFSDREFRVLKDSDWKPVPTYVRRKLDFTTLDHIGYGGAKNAEMVFIQSFSFYNYSC